MKTIHFNNCSDCPCKQVQYEEDEIANKISIYQICTRYKFTVIPHINVVPDWCPIPDDLPTTSIIDEIWDRNDNIL